MRKRVIVLISLMVIGVGFLSGCSETNQTTNNDLKEDTDESTAVTIELFTVNPSQIIFGDVATLEWVVTGASTVVIDNGIGTVSLTGDRIITPTETTTYKLTASNSKTIVSATTKIIVQYPISMSILSQVYSENEITWKVTKTQGEKISMWYNVEFHLWGESGQTDRYLQILTNDNDHDNYISVGDTFDVMAQDDGSYYFVVTEESSGLILFKSSLIKY